MYRTIAEIIIQMSWLKFSCQPLQAHKELQVTHNSLYVGSPPINSLWPSDDTWQHRSGSTLVQVMACCLTAPSHYLNQCWLIISKVLWHSPEGIIIWRSADTSQRYKTENWIPKSHPNFPGANELKFGSANQTACNTSHVSYPSYNILPPNWDCVTV